MVEFCETQGCKKKKLMEYFGEEMDNDVNIY